MSKKSYLVECYTCEHNGQETLERYGLRLQYIAQRLQELEEE